MLNSLLCHSKYVPLKQGKGLPRDLQGSMRCALAYNPRNPARTSSSHHPLSRPQPREIRACRCSPQAVRLVSNRLIQLRNRGALRSAIPTAFSGGKGLPLKATLSDRAPEGDRSMAGSANNPFRRWTAPIGIEGHSIPVPIIGLRKERCCASRTPLTS